MYVYIVGACVKEGLRVTIESVSLISALSTSYPRLLYRAKACIRREFIAHFSCAFQLTLCNKRVLKCKRPVFKRSSPRLKIRDAQWKSLSWCTTGNFCPNIFFQFLQRMRNVLRFPFFVNFLNNGVRLMLN